MIHTTYPYNELKKILVTEAWAELLIFEGGANYEQISNRPQARQNWPFEGEVDDYLQAQIQASTTSIDAWIGAGIDGENKQLSLWENELQAALCGFDRDADQGVVWVYPKTRAVVDQTVTTCLNQLAELALRGTDDDTLTLALGASEDLAFTWKAPAIHPLQISENVYQRAVAEALSKAPADPRETQSRTLSEYFLINGAPPELFRYHPLPQAQGAQFASVRMNHLIDSFYLFRLLIPFRAQSQGEVSEALRNALSSKLTGLLHNHPRMGWLTAWLTKAMARIAQAVASLNHDGPRVIFFVKGGRALNYWLGTPAEGQNDWDTQIVINPRLSQKDWYACLRDVHDLLLALLTQLRIEFDRQLVDHADEFADYLNEIARAPLENGEEPDDFDDYDASDSASLAGEDAPYHANCKAELIDIGIPRRDQPAALEEWDRLSGAGVLAQAQDGTVFPPRHYYVDEYLMMTREALLPSADASKAGKRIARFSAVLARKPAEAIAPLNVMPLTEAMIATLDHHAEQELLRLIGMQLVEAYNLRWEAGMLPIVDDAFATLLEKPAAIDEMEREERIAALRDSLADARQKNILRHVLIAHKLSAQLEQDARKRDTFIKNNADYFISLLSNLLGALQVNETLATSKVQMVVAGGFAAWLHGRHLGLEPPTLEPMRRILVKLHHPADTTCKAGTLLKDIETAVRQTLQPYGLHVQCVGSAEKPALVATLRLPGFGYDAVILKIRETRVPGARLPVTSLLEGVPVVGLPQLVADYTERAAKIDEFAARRTLKAARETALLMATHLEIRSDDDGD